jgi:hypothetical protein
VYSLKQICNFLSIIPRHNESNLSTDLQHHLFQMINYISSLLFKKHRNNTPTHRRTWIIFDEDLLFSKLVDISISIFYTNTLTRCKQNSVSLENDMRCKFPPAGVRSQTAVNNICCITDLR